MNTILKRFIQTRHLTARQLMFFCALAFSVKGFTQVQFSDETNNVGGPFHIGESWGASWGDINGDFYPDLFVSNHAMPNSILRNNGDGTFTDIIQQADASGVWTGVPDGDIHGGTFADFDNDGDQDIFVSRSSNGARIHLMENNGLGTFTERGDFYGIGANGGGRMSILFDYNNDGHLDMAFARNGDGLDLFESNPTDNKFSKQTSSLGIEDQCLRNNTGHISDLFNLGKLYYICNRESGLPEKVYDTSTVPFSDVTNILDPTGSIADAVLADFNNDLKQDLFAVRGRIRPSGGQRISSNRIEAWLSVARQVQFQKSFKFKADGPISLAVYARKIDVVWKEEISHYVHIGADGTPAETLPITLDPSDTSTHGIVTTPNRLGVYAGYDPVADEWTVVLSGGNNDSDSVYMVVDGTNLTEPTFSGLNATDLAITPKLLLNDGSKLANVGPAGIGAVSCNAVAAADFDNDMDIDLYLACRNPTENIANKLYLNDGNANFTLASNHGGEGPLGSGIDSGAGTAEMVIAADYNIDGFVDLFVTNGNRTFPHIHLNHFTGGGPDSFIRNLGNDNHWLQIDLQGINSNRDGVGAKVFVTAGGITQYREQNGMYHRWAHDSRRLHFGLANNTTADVRIEWPDGTEDTYNNIAADTLYLAIQDTSLNAVTPGASSSSLAISRDLAYEGDSVTLTVSLFPASDAPVTVNYASVDGSASESSSDYTEVSGTLTFAPGETTKTIDVDTLQDTVNESDEQFSIQLSDATDGIIMNQDTGIVVIKDDDGGDNNAPVVSIVGSTVSENDGTAGFTVTLSEAPSVDDVIIKYESYDISTTVRSDYERRFGQLTFKVGDVLRPKTRFVTIKQDSIKEDNETLIVRLFDIENANIADQAGIITIIDDEDLPTLNIDSATATEGGSAVLTVSLSPSSALPVSVDFATIANSATADTDYTSSSGTLTFGPSITTQTIIIDTLQDNLDEASESLQVELSNPSNAGLGQPTGLVTIQDDDEPPTLSINSIEINENESPATLTASLSAASGQVIIADFTTVAGTAIADTDFMSRVGRLTFAPSETEKTIDITILEDTLDESIETFDLTFTNAGNVTLTDESGTISILDNDLPPTISISDTNTIESQSAEVTVSLSTQSGLPITVEFESTNGTAIAGQDYSSANGTITFDALSTEQTISIPVTQDQIDETNESFNIVLSNPNNAAISDGNAVIEIEDDDLPPTINFSDLTISEANNTANIIVSLSEISGLPISVDYETEEISALADFDYTSISGTLNFAPGESEKTLIVPLLSDNIDEITETFRLAFNTANNATLTQNSLTVSIEDDDLPPTISIEDINVNENDGNAIIEVSLSAPSSLVITANFATQEDTATADLDYNSSTGTLTFNPLETTQQISISLVDDEVIELDEFFAVNISDAVNASLDKSTASIGIINDDGTVSINISNEKIAEGNSIEFHIGLSNQASFPVRVSYVTRGNNASQGFDYVGQSGTIEFAPQETSKSITINTLQDSLNEGNETFFIDFNNIVNAEINKPSALITIEDDDDAPGILVVDSRGSEASTTFNFIVKLDAPRSSPVSVNYSLANGSATTPADFVQKSGLVRFAAGETSQTVSIAIRDDSLKEGNETFRVVLSNPTNGNIVRGSGTMTIIDNDGPLPWLVPVIELLLEE